MQHMSNSRFDNLNINQILNSLHIEQKKIYEVEESNLEPVGISPFHLKKHDDIHFMSKNRSSMKQKQSWLTEKNYGLLDLENQNEKELQVENKENNQLINESTPPRKLNFQQHECDDNEVLNYQYKQTSQDHILTITPKKFNNIYSNYDAIEDERIETKQLINQQDEQKILNEYKILLPSNSKNNNRQCFDKQTPPSISSNKNSFNTQTPKKVSNDTTPTKNSQKYKINELNKKYYTNSINHHQEKQQTFMSSDPQPFYSDYKNNQFENQSQFNKKLFQEEIQNYKENKHSTIKIDFKIQNENSLLDQNLLNPIQYEIKKPQFECNKLFTPDNQQSKESLIISNLCNPVLLQQNSSMQENNNNNNIFNTKLDTIPKKGLIFQNDDKSTVKKNIIQNPSPLVDNNVIKPRGQVSIFSSKENSISQITFNSDIQEHNITNENDQNASNIFDNFIINEYKEKNDLFFPVNNKNIFKNIDNNLPQVNEFSFENEREDEDDEFQFNKIQMESNKNTKKMMFNTDDDFHNIFQKNKKIFDDSDYDSQPEDLNKFGQNSSVTDDTPIEPTAKLIKGKSVNLLSFENELRNQNEANLMTLDLNRRNSEVGLDNNDKNNKEQIDIGENEFTRAMPGIKIYQRQRFGSQSLKQKKQQTTLHQIPEGQTKKSKHYFQQNTNHFDFEDDYDVETQIRSKMIEQQDFQILFKKASSQFLGTNMIERNIRPQQYKHFNKENRFMKDFKIIQVIKQTSSTSVYKCQSNVNGLIYAIKAISIPKEMSEQDRIIKEVQSLVKFSTYGFGLLKFYNVWMEDSKLYLVTEHCMNNLKQIRHNNQKPSEQLIRQIIRDVCESLHFIHQNGCAHLGIKPENILANKKMRFKLADLGLSKIYNFENNHSNQESHYPYIAPELVGCSTLKQNIESTKADIFSFGAVLYELMTDQDLPKFGHEWENLRSGRFHKLMNSVKYSASLKNLIKSMLLRNPQLRPSSQDILNQIPSDNVLELELKYLVEETSSLSKKLDELQKKQQQNIYYQNDNSKNILAKKNSF